MSTRVPALLAVLCAALPALAHEHMYIGSDRPKGGALVLRYDFTRAFPLVPAPRGTGFIGTDPAFNAQINDDPADGIYRLKPGTVVKMQLVALDPPVAVDLNGVMMTAPRATARIGKMPYLHQHPQWLLNLPPTVAGDYHLSFRVTAAGYRPSAVYTATLDNGTTPTTTTTTLPGQTCAPRACDDHDLCTFDACVGGACQHTDAMGIDAVRCRMAPLADALDDIRPTTAKGRRVQKQLFKVFNTVEPALDAVAAGGRDARRLVKRAQKQLNRFARIVDRGVAVHGVSSDQADVLRTLAGNVYDQLVLIAL
jgi:hypothetical protein